MNNIELKTCLDAIVVGDVIEVVHFFKNSFDVLQKNIYLVINSPWFVQTRAGNELVIDVFDIPLESTHSFNRTKLTFSKYEVLLLQDFDVYKDLSVKIITRA